MDLVGNFTKAYKNYANFSGRASRAEYWQFSLALLIIYIVIFGLVALLKDSFIGGIISVLFMLFALGTFIPALALSIRRLHDTTRSGWFILIQFIPFVGPIILLVFMCQASTIGTNEYGPNPYGVGEAEGVNKYY